MVAEVTRNSGADFLCFKETKLDDPSQFVLWELARQQNLILLSKMPEELQTG